MTRRIDRDRDIHRDCSIGTSGCDRIHWYSSGKRVVETGGRRINLGGRGAARGGMGVGVFVVDDCEGEGLVGGFGAGAGCDF